MHPQESVIFTNMCMISDGRGNVVVQQRADSNWPGIALPGGHVEPGECLTDAVVREVFEETGLTISNVRLCGIKNWFSGGSRYVVLLYRTQTYSGELRSSDEGKVFWAPLSALPEMDLADSMKATLKLFCDDALVELFYYRENGELIEVLK